MQFIKDDPEFIDEVLKHSKEFQCINICKNALDREIVDTMKAFRPESKEKIDEFFISILVFRLNDESQRQDFNRDSLIALVDKEPLYLNALLRLNPAGFCNSVGPKFFKKATEINKSLLNQLKYFINSAQISLWPNEIKDCLTILSIENFQLFVKEYKEFGFLLICPQLYPIFSVKFWVKSGLEIQTMNFELKKNGAVAFLPSDDRSSDRLYSNIKSAFAFVARISHLLNHVDQIKIIIVKEGLLHKDQQAIFEKKNINISGKNFLLITKEIIDNFEEKIEEDVADEPDSDSDASASMSDQDDLDENPSEDEESSSPPPSFP